MLGEIEYTVTPLEITDEDVGHFTTYGIEAFVKNGSEKILVYCCGDVSTDKEKVDGLVYDLVKNEIPLPHLHFEVVKAICEENQ